MGRYIVKSFNDTYPVDYKMKQFAGVQANYTTYNLPRIKALIECVLKSLLAKLVSTESGG